jgi:hypothetical protein
MTARALRRKPVPSDTWRSERRPAFHMPANDNHPVLSRRLLAWVMITAGLAAFAVVVGSGF